MDAYLGTLITKEEFEALKEDERMNRASEYKDAFRKRTSWKAAKPFWQDLQMSQIDSQTSRDYAKWRSRAANTLRNELGAIRTALNWAAHDDRKLIPKAPKIVLPAMPESTVEHLTRVETQSAS